MESPASEPKCAKPDTRVDRGLITKAARGDAHAFAQIYASSAPGVHRYVRRLIWDPWDAEDVTQEVFLKILMGLHQYDPDRAAFSAWTLRVARNAGVDHMRRRHHEAAPDELENCAAVDEAGRQCGESLREALAELSESQREVLILRALAGLTPREVASRVMATRGSINTLYHRARLAARDRLVALAAAPCTRRPAPAQPRVVSEAA